MKNLSKMSFIEIFCGCGFAGFIVPGLIVFPALLCGWSSKLLTFIVVVLAPPSLLLVSQIPSDPTSFKLRGYVDVAIATTTFYLLATGLLRLMRKKLPFIFGVFSAYLASCLLFLLTGVALGRIAYFARE